MPALAHQPAHSPSRGFLSAIAIVIAWTVFGILSTAHFFLIRDSANTTFMALAEHIVVFYWGWALLTPAVVWVARRIGKTERTSQQTGIVLLGVFATIITHATIYQFATRILGITDHAFTLSAFRDHLLRHGGGDVATYLVLLGAILYRDALRKNYSEKEKAVALEAQLTRADLELLRWQLQPHFLFNALNALSTLVLKADVSGAERAIALVAQYLRHTLRQPANAMVSLAHEIQMAERYVAIEALRFGAGVRLESSVAPELLAHEVPSMILQPLVENAIRHGIGAPRASSAARESAHMCVVSISAERAGDRLLISVTDPAHAANATGTGFGLRYVRERLSHHYGDSAQFELRTEATRTIALLELPFVSSTKYVLRTA